MLPLPAENQVPVDLADWLEMNALVGKAGQVSLDDLRTALKAAASGHTLNASREQQTAQLESVIASVRRELADRSTLARVAYPFNLRSSSLERRHANNARRSSTYAFCLMLSYTHWEQRKIAGYFPERAFEEVCCGVAERYLGGKSVRFGWPRVRSKLPSQFDQAINQLCKRVGEGDRYRPTDATGSEKDGGVDVVAWRSIDARTGKLLLFGACATGQDWEDKLDELQPMQFCNTYFEGTVSPYPTKAFFTPKRVAPERWQLYSGRAGIVFDRCRVSVLLPKLPSMKAHGDPREWLQRTMERTGQEADK